MIILMRHAQRGDNQLPTQLSQIPHDPPITTGSTRTIQDTAAELHSILQAHHIHKIRVVTSRFLRCLMTAHRMQGELQARGYTAGEMQVDDQISEYMREDWYAEYPLDRLIYHSEHLGKYVPGARLAEANQEQARLAFPQNYVQFHHRVGKFKQQLQFPEEGTCLIIVTHGFVVRELCFTMNQLPSYQNEIKYCGYAAYVRRTGMQVLVRAKL